MWVCMYFRIFAQSSCLCFYVYVHTHRVSMSVCLYTCICIEQIELQAKLLNYFLGSNKSNINQSQRLHFGVYIFTYMYTEFGWVCMYLRIYTQSLHVFVFIYTIGTWNLYMLVCIFAYMCTEFTWICVYTEWG